MKECCHCREAKPLTEFSRAKNRKDGLYPQCKACVKLHYQQNREKNLAYAAAYHEAHREESRAYSSAYRQTEAYKEAWRARRADPAWQAANNAWTRENRAENREHHLAVRRAWYAANREHAAGYARRKQAEWRADNPDGMRAKNANWRAKNRHIDRGRSRLRRAMIAACEGHFTGEEWAALKARYNHTCLHCGCQEPEIKLTADHVIPLTKGGSNYIANIQPLCHSCNARKSAHTIDYRAA